MYSLRLYTCAFGMNRDTNNGLTNIVSKSDYFAILCLYSSVAEHQSRKLGVMSSTLIGGIYFFYFFVSSFYKSYTCMQH
jgi:hypothetical protein